MEKIHRIKRCLSLLLATLMLFMMVPTVARAASDDITGHWAEDTIRTWIDLKMLSGDGAGNYRPDDSITRAEFMTIVNTYKGYTAQSFAVRGYTDVATDAWYYNEVAIALEAGYVIGTSPTTMSPEKPITREEAMVIITRITGLRSSQNDLSTLSKVNDGAEVSNWALTAVAATIANGLVQGNAGYINPRNNIRRAETVVLMDRARTDTRTYAFEGTYRISSKNAIISTSNVTLENVTISGDLTIAAAVGSGTVYINHATVNGKVYVKGGGMTSVYIKNSKLDEISITKNEVSVVFQDGTTAAYASMTGSGSSIQIAKGANIDSVVVAADAVGAFVRLDIGAEVSNVEINAPDATLHMAADAMVTTLRIQETGEDAIIEMAGGSKITTADISAATVVSGKGTISTANIKAKHVVIETKPGTTKIDSGITANIAGRDVTGTTTGGGGGIVAPSVSVSDVFVTDQDNIKVIMTDATLLKEAFTVQLTSNHATTIAVSSANYIPAADQTPGYYALALGSSLAVDTAYTVTVRKSGHTSYTKYDVQWQPAGTMSGTITAKQADDSTTGATGLAGATVTIKNNMTVIKTGITAAAGSYSIEAVPIGTYTIEVSAIGYKTETIAAQTLTTAGLTGQDKTLQSTATKLYSGDGAIAVIDNTAMEVRVLEGKYPSELNAVLEVQHSGTVKIYNTAKVEITSVSTTTALTDTDYIVVTAEDGGTNTTYKMIPADAGNLLKAAVQAVTCTAPATAGMVKLTGTTTDMKYYVTAANALPGAVNDGTVCHATTTEMTAAAGQVITIYAGTGNANATGAFKGLTVARANIGPAAAPNTAIAFAASSEAAGKTLVTLTQGGDGIAPTRVEYYVAADGAIPPTDAVWTVYTAAFETAATTATKVYVRIEATSFIPASEMTNGGTAVALTEIKAAAAPTADVFTVSSVGGTAANTTALVPAGTDSANAVNYEYVIVAHDAATSADAWTVCAITKMDRLIVTGVTDDVYLRIKATAALPASEEVKALDAVAITPVAPNTVLTLSKGTNAGTTKLSLVMGGDGIAITTLEYLVAADTTGTPIWTPVTAALINNVAVTSGADKVFLRVRAVGSTPASAATAGIVVGENMQI